MRKIVIAIMLVAFISLQAACQKISLGIQAGFSLANMHENYWDKSKHGDNKPGIIIGVTGYIPFKSNSFQPAINFVQKGFKKEESGSGYVFSDEITLSYIEVPLNFLYHHRLSGLQIFAGAGPSVAFAISGKEKTNQYGTIASYTFHFGNDVDKDDLRRVEYGANFLAGVTWRNIFLDVNYNLGLSSLIPGGNENGTLKNNYLGVRFGYLLAPISKKDHSN
jgi:hypothetical protein